MPPLSVLLSLIHLHLSADRIGEAIALLAPLVSQPNRARVGTLPPTALLHRPALVAILVALHLRTGAAVAAEAAVDALQAAVTYWHGQAGQGVTGANQWLRLFNQELSGQLLKSGRQAEALIPLERLFKDQKDRDPTLLCQLVLSGAQVDATTAVKYAAFLPEFQGAAALDANRLEATTGATETTVKKYALLGTVTQSTRRVGTGRVRA